jgi:AcrR family transcriptional regulator
MPAEDRREQLLRAALDVIVERGFADTRITDVAERAGTSPALVIYYFKTRDALLTEALRYSEDSWYAEGVKRLAEIHTAAAQLAAMIAMTLLPTPGQPDADPNRLTEWLLWLDLWALSPRSPGVAAVRREFDERWHRAIRDIVARGQEAGEFAGPGDGIDPDDFALTLAALLDGLAVRIALKDPDCSPARAYDLAMAYAAGQLGFVPPN